MATEIQIYSALLRDIKTRIHKGQINVARSINYELTELYWDIGSMIHHRQQEEGWGAGIIPKLSKDIVNELPEIKGFSERNLKRMLRFYREYRTSKMTGEKVPQAVAQLPWSHNALIIERVKGPDARFWYAEQIKIEGWSRDSLIQMIKSRVGWARFFVPTRNYTKHIAKKFDLL